MLEMLECDFGAISRDGAESKGGRGVAGVVAGGFALVGFLFILEAVSSKVVEARN